LILRLRSTFNKPAESSVFGVWAEYGMPPTRIELVHAV
jgi:hypothetical protein